MTGPKIISLVEIHSTKISEALRLRFYVKSISDASRDPKIVNLAILEALNFVFGKFQSVRIAKNHQNQNSEPQKLSKWQFLRV